MPSRDVTIVAHDVGPIGGMEQMLSQLIWRLAERGREVTVVARSIDLPAHPRIRQVRVPGPRRPFVIAYPWFFIAGTLATARARRGPVNTTGAIVFNRAEVSTVHFVHAARRGRERRMRVKRFDYALAARLAAPMSRWAERAIVARAFFTRNVVTVCTSARDELVAAYPNVEARLTVIPNAVDTDRFRPNPATRRSVRSTRGLGEDDRVALFVGSEWRGKGVALIVEALALAPTWRLVVVGEGDEGALVRLARDTGVEHRVICTGVRPDPERFMAAADCFVHASDGETDSMTIMQAVASGLPVIATDVGAARERIGSRGEGGLIVERSPEAIADALNALATDPATALRMGERNTHVAQGWSWDAVADAYDELYDAVAHGEGGS